MLTTLHTNGQGFWSTEPRAVHVTEARFRITDTSEGDRWGFLDIFFDKDEWNIYEIGLVYTDPLFEQEVIKQLNDHFEDYEVTSKDISYPEQGMQGIDFVNEAMLFSISTKFAAYLKENFEHEDWVEWNFFDYS